MVFIARCIRVDLITDSQAAQWAMMICILYNINMGKFRAWMCHWFVVHLLVQEVAWFGEFCSCSGDPQLFEDYWRQHPEMGTVVTPGWYRMGYQFGGGQLTNFVNHALEAAIRELHALTGNAVTEGRYIVLGTGSMQLINAAVHSLALQQPNVSNVVALAPYYGVSGSPCKILFGAFSPKL
jgi:hypothetical protein